MTLKRINSFAQKTAWFVILLPLLISCTKEVGYRPPEASFSLDKEIYAAGDRIVINNTSQFSDDCQWTLTSPSGSVVTNAPGPMGKAATKILNWSHRLPPIKLSIFAENGWYTLSMKAYNGKTNVVSEVEKKFLVVTEYGFIRAKLSYPVKWDAYFFIDDELITVMPEILRPTFYPAAVFTYRVPVGNRVCRYVIYSNSYKTTLLVQKDQTTDY